MVVDDEPSIRALLREYLGAEGFQVLEADSGASALQQLGVLDSAPEHQVDLVMLDIGLPDGTGIDCIALIRHLLDQLPDTQVPEEKLEFPPLAAAPLKEKFTGPVKPIKAR